MFGILAGKESSVKREGKREILEGGVIFYD
jgi:hypothetical protein